MSEEESVSVPAASAAGSSGADQRYEPDVLVWVATAVGALPGLGILVSGLCAIFGRRREAAKWLWSIAAVDLVIVAGLALSLSGGFSRTEVGTSEQALLGVGFDPGATENVVIEGISPNTVAAAAGLEEGDVILSVDGEEVTAFSEVQAAVAHHGPGSVMALRVLKNDGTARDMRVVLGSRLVPSDKSKEFHSNLVLWAAVGGSALAVIFGFWGMLRSEERWPGVVLVLLGVATSTLLLVDSDLVGRLSIGVGAFGALALFGSMRNFQTFDGLAPGKASITLGLGVAAAFGWGLRASLAALCVSALLDVREVPPSLLFEGLQGTSSVLTPGILLLLALVAAPVLEELVFRGALLPWLATFLTPWRAVAISSLLFGALHVSSHGLHIASAIAFGGVLGWLRIRSRSLVLCMVLHLAINAVASLRVLL